MNNVMIANKLSGYANYLAANQTALYRIRAYRRAAATVRMLARPLQDVLDCEGTNGLRSLPGIGAHLAFTLAELLRTGEFKTWRDAREALAPEPAA